MSKRSTRAKDPENDKRKLTWKSNLSKAHQKQKEMKETYENQKLKELQIYDSSDSDTDSESDSYSSESEDEFVIKPKKSKSKSKTKSKPEKASKNSVLEELRAMREEVNKLRREKSKANKKEKGTVIQVMPTVPAEKSDSVVSEMKRKALINF